MSVLALIRLSLDTGPDEPARAPAGKRAGVSVMHSKSWCSALNDLLQPAVRCFKGRTTCAIGHDGAQRLRWILRQHETIFRLLLQYFGPMIGSVTPMSLKRARP